MKGLKNCVSYMSPSKRLFAINFITCSYRPELLEKCHRSIESSVDCPFEFVVIDNKDGGKNIFQAYDEGAEKAQYEILCFHHEDIEILSHKYWLEPVKELFKYKSTGVIGVAGSRDLTQTGIWWDRGNRLSGAAMHVHQGQEYMTSFGGPYGRVVVVDGLIFLIRKNVYLQLGGYKDSYFLGGFHFYDVDLCLRAHWAGYKNYTTNLIVRHQSIGVMPPQWDINRQQWLARYGRRLPVRV